MRTSSDPASASRSGRWVLGGLLVVAAPIVYLNSLYGPFVFDDVWTVQDQLLIRRPEYVPALFTLSPPRFLVMLSLAVNYWFHGLDVRAYHSLNILLHALNVALVWRLFASWLPGVPEGHRWRGALVAALGFALTPMQTEAVAYVTGRSTLMGTMWVLCSVLAYARARRMPRGTRATLVFGLSLACYGVGHFTKEIAAIVPALLVVWELTGHAGAAPLRGRQWLWPIAPYGVILIGALLMRRALLGAMALPILPRGVFANLINQSFITWQYAFMEFLPLGMTIDHGTHAATSVLDPRVVVGMGLWCCAGAIAWRARRRHPTVTLGLAWFAVGLTPDSSVVPLQDLMADHRAYLPGIGLWALVGVGWTRWHMQVHAAGMRRRRRAIVLTVMALGLLGTWTVVRNCIWRDEMRLWQEAVRRAPDHARAWANLAGRYARIADYPRAIECANHALELEPGMPAAYMNRGVARLELGQLEAAERDFASFLAVQTYAPQTWITARGTLARAQFNLGVVYMRMGRYSDAAQAYKRALQLNPISHRILYNLGAVYERLGDFTAAEYVYLQLVNRPDVIPTHWEHLHRVSGLRQAEATLQNATLESPRDPYVHARLGVFYDDLALLTKAEKAYGAALILSPREPVLHALLGNIYRKQGRAKDAALEYRTALELEPDQVEALWWLGQLLLRQGLPEEGGRYLRHARRLDAAAGTAQWRPDRALSDGRMVLRVPTPAASVPAS